jgi:hypothetical protein
MLLCLKSYQSSVKLAHRESLIVLLELKIQHLTPDRESMKSFIQICAAMVAALATLNQSAIAATINVDYQANIGNRAIDISVENRINLLTNNVSYHDIYNDKLSQCENVITVVNQTVDNTGMATNFGANGDIETFNELGRVFDKATKDLESVNLSDEQLKTYKSQFLAMYRGASKINKQIFISIKKQDIIGVTEELRKSKTIFSPERDLSAGLIQYCSKISKNRTEVL